MKVIIGITTAPVGLSCTDPHLIVLYSHIEGNIIFGFERLFFSGVSIKLVNLPVLRSMKNKIKKELEETLTYDQIRRK